MDTIVITGSCRPQAQLLTEKLRSKYHIVGIDSGKPSGPEPQNVEYIEGDLRKKIFQHIMRKYSVFAVIHLAVNYDYQLPPAKRHEINVMSAQSVLEGCIKYKVKKFIFLSDHTVYGALPSNPMWIKENSPLNGSRLFKENTSVVAVDHMITELFWRAPDIETVILRPVNVLGTKTRGLLNTYLRLKFGISVFGFNPMMQVIHELDVCRAIEIALTDKVKGIFNLTGPGSLPLSVLAEEAELTRIQLISPVAYSAASIAYRLNQFPFPSSALSLFQYQICIDGESFMNTTNFRPKYSLEETIRNR